MKRRRLLRVSVVSVVALGLLGLAACADPKKTTTYACEAGPASPPAVAAAPATDPPLPTEAAGEEAKVAVADADVLLPDGRVPLVTVEETPAGPEVTSTPVAGEAEAEAVAEAAAAGGDLVAVEADSIVTTDGVAPDDPEFVAGNQYALQRLGFVTTWDDTFTGPQSGDGQTVAVLDTGVDVTHDDLDGQVVGSGWSFVDNSATDDPHGHGTFIAGIVAALTDNALDIAGAAPAASILPVQVLDESGKGFTSDVAQGITWAADHGAHVINLSLGGPNSSQALELAVKDAIARGIPVISSTGNTGKCGAPAFPAAFPEVLAVGATDMDNEWAGFSTTGPYVNVVAPGVEITSTAPEDTTGVRSGTSFAAPYAAAAAAIVQATHPGFGVLDVYVRLIQTATDLGTPGWDPLFGSGLINVHEAAG